MSFNPFSNKKIILGVSGSIACYKAADLASKLSQAGAQVNVILTEAATRFITPLTFQSVTENVGARRVANLAAYGGVAAAIVYLLWLGLSRRLRRGEGGLLLLALAGLAGNAAVTGILSGVAHRYQARIIWVVPVVAIGFFLARRSLGRPPR